MSRKIKIYFICVISLLLIYAIGKRFFFPTVIQNVEEVKVENGVKRDGLEETYKVDLINENISGKQPRTGIGVLEPNHFLIVIVDGRAEGYSIGMTFDEFADVFASYGCEREVSATLSI